LQENQYFRRARTATKTERAAELVTDWSRAEL